MNDVYKKLVYEHAVWAYLVDELEVQYVCEDIAPPKTLHTDSLSYAERAVPQEALRSVLQDLQIIRDDLLKEIGRYGFVKVVDDVRNGKSSGPSVKIGGSGQQTAGKTAKPKRKPRAAR